LEVPPELYINAGAGLMQVLLENLIGNAWKFTSTRKSARIEIGAFEKEGARCFFVRDNGVGFDMKDADKLFQPYQRLHSQQEFKGSGIGLAIVRRIMDRHGGKIWAIGEKDNGATICFCFP
jgi:light-regulated signal transduction histidine kinase (bacteriophytochrome)